jgi:hypothetical protein
MRTPINAIPVLCMAVSLVRVCGMAVLCVAVSLMGVVVAVCMGLTCNTCVQNTVGWHAG